MLFTSFVGANTVNGPFSSNWSPISAILMSCISSEKRLSEANTSSNLPAGGVKTCSYRNRYVIIRNQRKVCLKKASGFHQQSRNCKPLGTHEFTPMFHAIRGAQSLVVCVLLCRSELMQLIKIAEIGDQLEENGPFTVFAPTNDVNNIFYFSFYSESGSSWS
jgi:hypothetical protein